MLTGPGDEVPLKINVNATGCGGRSIRTESRWTSSCGSVEICTPPSVSSGRLSVDGVGYEPRVVITVKVDRGRYVTG